MYIITNSVVIYIFRLPKDKECVRVNRMYQLKYYYYFLFSFHLWLSKKHPALNQEDKIYT